MTRPVAHFAAAIACVLCLGALAPAAVARPAANAPLDVEVFDRRSGEALPVYRHRGELYVAGEPGHEYEIRLRNRSGGASSPSPASMA